MYNNTARVSKRLFLRQGRLITRAVLYFDWYNSTARVSKRSFLRQGRLITRAVLFLDFVVKFGPGLTFPSVPFIPYLT